MGGEAEGRGTHGSFISVEETRFFRRKALNRLHKKGIRAFWASGRVTGHLWP